MKKHIIKIVLIGERSSDKNDFFVRFKDNKYNPWSSFGIDVFNKEININNHNLTIRLWKETHTERFLRPSRAYYRGSKGILFVVDLTYEATIDYVIREIESRDEQEESTSYIIGTKIDTTIENRDEMIKYSKFKGLQYCECSSLTGENVHEIMNRLLRDILEKEMLKQEEKQSLYNKPEQKQNNNKKNKKCIVF